MEKIFPWVWRVTILSLPWQTRWFSDAFLGEWPWEQGRLSVYASWFLIGLTVIAGQFWKIPFEKKTKVFLPSWLLFVFLFIVNLLVTRGDQEMIRAIVQWWGQIVLLGLFVWTLWRREVSVRFLIKWLVLSMVPVALLGCVQYTQQMVDGTKWFGMATHDPRNLGVSVIEHGEFRVLRAYGVFPHPNIFGGWLAVVLSLSVWLAVTTERKGMALILSLLSGLFTAALVVTYSRSAWIAALVGILFMLWSFRKKPTVQYQYLGIALVSILVIGGSVVYSQRGHVLVRFQGEARLEQKSLDERSSGLKEGLLQWWKRPFFGTGPNAELYVMQPLRIPLPPGMHDIPNVFPSPPVQPPHMVFLLALIDFGVVGILVLMLFIFRFVSFKMLKHPLMWMLFVLCLLDHYPWSTWSGQCLVMLILLIVFISDRHILLLSKGELEGVSFE